MDLLTITLVILAIIIGFIIGKYITEQIKWGDKKRLIEEHWRLKLEAIEKNYQLELKKLQHRWELKYFTDLKEIKELIKSAERYMRQDAIKRSRRGSNTATIGA